MIDMDQIIKGAANPDLVTETSKEDNGINVDNLSLEVILGDRYEEYENLKVENKAQRQKNEELKATIEKVKAEIEQKKNKLLDEAAQEYRNLKSEEDMLNSKLDSLLGKAPITEEII